MIIKQPKQEQKQQRKFDPIPADMCSAVCIQIIDLGFHEESFKGQPPSLKRKVYIMFETEHHGKNEETGEEFNRAIGKEYTVPLYPNSNITKDINSWLGKPLTEQEMKEFNAEQLLGKDCLITVFHQESKNTGNVYAVIGALNPYNSRFPKVEPQCKPFFFDMSKYSTTEEVDKILEELKVARWLQEKIRVSVTYKDLIPSELVSDDNLPF